MTFTAAGCGCSADVIYKAFPEALHSRIKVVQQLSSENDLIELYRGHSIFVLPSYFEGQPLSMLEAAAMGLAIVTTNVCGMKDFVEDGANGFVVGIGDPQSLQQALGKLIEDPHLTLRLGEAARVKAQEFSWENSARSFLHAYQQAIADSSKT